MQAYFFVSSSASLEHGMFAVNGLITAASDCIIRELRQRNKLTAFTLQSKQLAGVCAGSVTHQHLHLIGFSWPSSPIDQTMTSKVIVAADIRSQRGWNSRYLKRLRNGVSRRGRRVHLRTFSTTSSWGGCNTSRGESLIINDGRVHATTSRVDAMCSNEAQQASARNDVNLTL